MSEPEEPTAASETAGASDPEDRERPDALGALLDALVFAPVGAFLHGPETVGDLAAKGRQDLANARFIGRMVIDRASRDGHERLSGFASEVGARWVELLLAAARAAGVPLSDTGATEDTTSSGGPRLRVVGGHDPEPQAEPDGADAHLDAPDVDELAIPGYDTLAASQVVPRLDDLSDSELADVQDYERAHRGRMTILSRIAQLRAS